MRQPSEDFMQEALRLAARALDRGELPIGAVVVLGDRILAAAHTAERAERRLLVHAELRALDIADRMQPFPGKRAEVRLFTTLEPCLMCLGAAMSFHLGEIHYALESPGDGAVGLVRHWQRDEQAVPSYLLPQSQQHHGAPRQQAIEMFRVYAARHAPSAMREWAASLAALNPT